MTEQEQMIDALESVRRYLQNQELSEIGMQVKGKVLEALNRVNKNFILSDVSGSVCKHCGEKDFSGTGICGLCFQIENGLQTDR